MASDKPKSRESRIAPPLPLSLRGAIRGHPLRGGWFFFAVKARGVPRAWLQPRPRGGNRARVKRTHHRTR